MKPRLAKTEYHTDVIERQTVHIANLEEALRSQNRAREVAEQRAEKWRKKTSDAMRVANLLSQRIRAEQVRAETLDEYGVEYEVLATN